MPQFIIERTVPGAASLNQDQLREIAKTSNGVVESLGVPEVIFLPDKYLGHYVAGMIARRHDITVQMDSDGQRGSRATVTLPSGLLSSEGAAPERAALANRAFAPAPAAPATTGLARGGVAGAAAQRGPVVIDALAIAEAQRARYVRDTLSKLSAGLDRGRDAADRAPDAGDGGGVGVEASPTGPGQDGQGSPDTGR